MTFDQLKNTKALSITIGIHILLLLLLLLWRYQLPAQQNMAIELLEVNLGSSDDGFGTEQPEDMAGPAPLEPAAGGAAQPDAIQHIETDEDASPVRLPKTNKSKPESKPKTSATTSSTRTTRSKAASHTASNNAAGATASKAKYRFEGGQGAGGNSASRNNPGGSEGDGSGNGDKGVPGGVVGGAYISAVPNLRGRSLRTRPDPNATFREGGKVVVSVTVDREGNILRSSIVSAANSTLRAIVQQKLKQVTFTRSAQAPPEQTGTITFNFKTH